MKLVPALLLAALSTACVRREAGPEPAKNPDSAAGGTAVAAPLTIELQPGVTQAKPLLGLKRGVNLGNGFDAPSLGAWGVTPSEAHFDLAKQAGLDHMRLPVRFSAHAMKEAPYTVDAEFFAKIDWAVDAALSRGLYLVLDLHHYEELMTDPAGHEARAIAIWKQVAERYKDRSDKLLFELLNEPCKELNPEKLNALHQKLIATVRESNPTRMLIVDGYFWASANYLEALQVPAADPNIALSFHMYQPILFTHQGAPWMDPEFRSSGIIFPGPPNAPAQRAPEAQATDWTRSWLDSYEKNPASSNPSSVDAVRREFDIASRIAAKTGRSIYMGEFGAIDFAEPVSRENYLRVVRREAEHRGIPWTVWDDGGRMQGMDVHKGTWTEVVARALLNDQPGGPAPSVTVAGGAPAATTAATPASAAPLDSAAAAE